MKTIKIEKEVTKAEVYVVVDTNEKMLEVEEILSSSNQMYLGRTSGTANILVYDKQHDAWYKLLHAEDRQYEITVPQLAEMLGVKYPLKTPAELGVWYVSKGNLLLCRSTISGEAFGFYRGVWSTDYETPEYIDGKTWKKAEYNRVKEALVAEANRRYKSGDYIKIMVGPCEGKKSSAPITCNNLSLESGVLWCKEGIRQYTLFKDGVWAEVLEEEEPKLPTLEELIEEARSKIEVKLRNYPCWVDGERTVSKYCIDENRIQAYTEKEAIAQYVKERVLELL